MNRRIRLAVHGALVVLAALSPFACGRAAPKASEGKPVVGSSSSPSTEASTSLDVPVVTEPTLVNRDRFGWIGAPGDRNFREIYQLVAHPDAAAAKELDAAIDAEVRADEAAARTAKLRSFYGVCETTFARPELVVVRCDLQRNVPGVAETRVEIRTHTWLLRDGHARELKLADLFVPGSSGLADADAGCLESLRARGYPKAEKMTRLGPLLRSFMPTTSGLRFQFQTGELDDEIGEGPTCTVSWSSLLPTLRPDGPLTALAKTAPPVPSASASK